MHTEEDMLTSGPILSAFFIERKVSSNWEQTSIMKITLIIDGASHLLDKSYLINKGMY